MIDMSLVHASPFYELTALLVLAAVTGFAGIMLRQPMVVSFIAVGLLSGPSALNIIQSHENIELLADLGITVLLFLVGLKLDLKLIRTLGSVALATGLGQVALTTLAGFIIARALGMDNVVSMYIAVAMAFSSTIIIVKMLSDKKEADSMHGRIAIGILIVQDLVVVLAMMLLSAAGNTQAGSHDLGNIAGVTIAGAAVLAAAGLFIRYLVSPLMNRIAHSPELLITFAIGWAALLASLCSYFGFSKELGGLLAGVSLASTLFREAIVARLSSLRDFLLLFFFIALGAKLDLSHIGAQVFPAMVFSLFVLIGKPLIVMALMGTMGYRKRTGFLTGLTVAQISEFSLIFMAMGLSLGHVGSDSMALVTLTGLITIALSVYMITYSNKLYRWSESALGIFERSMLDHKKAAAQLHDENRAYDVILFGLGRYGTAIAENLKKEGYTFLAVDFNPDVVKHWKETGHEAVYGDACDIEFLGSLPLGKVKWVISAMPQHDVGIMHEDPRVTLIHGLRHQKYPGGIAVSAHDAREIKKLVAKGANLVFLPFQDAADQAVGRMKHSHSA